ncbi:MAG TPA: MFS transporter [Burkholderiales bacterium]|nr:MFS transporter [Burkholderiales bacterium]
MNNNRKNVFALAACQSLLVMNNAMMISVGTLAADALAQNKMLVTLPATGYIIGGGLTTLPISLFMKRHGRRAGFTIGCIFGMIGATLAAAAMLSHNFWMLCLAALVSGVYTGSGGFYRFAAADMASAGNRSKAISLVLAGGIIGGIFGPESSKVTKDLLDTVFAGSFVSLVALALIALLIVRRLDLPNPSIEEQHGSTRPLAEIMRQPVFIVALLGGITAYGVMNLLMAATPLAMKMCSHPYGAAMLVIEWHIIAMFAPAFGTGWLIVRLGTLPVMFLGVLLKVAAIAIAVSSTAVPAFWSSMVLIGVGWCFLFVGGTTLLTEACAPAEKAKTQGINDMLIYVTMASTSLTSGAILYGFGWNTLNYTALPLLCITAIAILWLATIRRSARLRSAAVGVSLP